MYAFAIAKPCPTIAAPGIPAARTSFTVNPLQRRGNDLLTRRIGLLRDVVRAMQSRHPFEIHGWVVPPEHMHCVLQFPEDETDFATRWRLIKMEFSKALPKTERLSKVRANRGERGIWQGRFWEP
jgi:putative transposase